MKERVRVAAEACTARSAPRCTALHHPGRISQGKAPPSQRKQASHPWWRWSPRFPACRACDSVRGVAIGPPIALCSHLFFPFPFMCKPTQAQEKATAPASGCGCSSACVQGGTHTQHTTHTRLLCLAMAMPQAMAGWPCAWGKGTWWCLARGFTRPVMMTGDEAKGIRIR